jgi:hypothetical protein
MVFSIVILQLMQLFCVLKFGLTYAYRKMKRWRIYLCLQENETVAYPSKTTEVFEACELLVGLLDELDDDELEAVGSCLQDAALAQAVSTTVRLLLFIFIFFYLFIYFGYIFIKGTPVKFGILSPGRAQQ